MGQKLSVVPIGQGLKTDKLAFNIDNDSFPTLINAYQWRGRLKRKRGTSLLGRLERYFDSSLATFSVGPSSTGVAPPYKITLDGSGSGNILTGPYASGANHYALQTNGNIVPGTVVITDGSGNTYKDIPKDGNLVQTALNVTAITHITQAAQAVLTIVGNTYSMSQTLYITGVLGMTQINNAYYTITNVSGSLVTIDVDSTGFSPYISGGNAYVLAGTINYGTGAINIPAEAGDTLTVVMQYYPDLPVMGIREVNLNATQFPTNLAFDTTYSYNINNTFPYLIYDVSFYKNPQAADPYNYLNYVQKTSFTPVSWNGQSYQQFWTTNYQGALWACNGINVPFAKTNIGMQFQKVNSMSGATWVDAHTMQFNIDNCPLVIGDFVFVNEFSAGTPANSNTLNFQTGYVTATSLSGVTLTVTVYFPNATIANDTYSGGLLQYLTNRSDVTKDCIRWYDGDPTAGNGTGPSLTSSSGWVNFMPPISAQNFSIDDEPAAQYYLVGARLILPFKDRLLFFGPVVQTSSPNSQVYLQDTIIYSQNGTPFYTASFPATAAGISAKTVFTAILTPVNQTAAANSYWGDVTGLGGFISAGYAQPILSASPNEDVIIVGFSSRQTRLVYSGNDIIPFNFFVINSEYGTASTFSVINFDRGVATIGDHGILITAQTGSERIDLQIPDQVFQFNLQNNGFQRVCAQRDFINEWIYFTYPDDISSYTFPNQTLLYNYRDNSWAIFNESYTSYGQFRKKTGLTWATVGSVYPTWASWNAPWDSSSSNLLQPQVVAGNQQGFVLFREDGSTNEGNSLYIRSISGNTITSPDHTLNDGDYIVISGALGTIGSTINGNIYSVFNATENTFMCSPSLMAGTYLGGGVIKRMYVPFIETKQFPVAWEMGRKTRIGFQQYLISTTPNGQIQLLIYLSQNSTSPKALPNNLPTNSATVYGTTIYTCPEGTNLGLTPANINLQMPTAFHPGQQQQIWHRINTSLIGDTVQLAFTMSDEQMRDDTFSNQFEEIEIHGFNMDLTPSQMLS